MLEFDHVSKVIGNKEILKDISFKVEKEKIIALIGSNGSGKSTLINQLVEDNANIKLNGENYKKTNAVSILMQNPRIPDHFRVSDLLTYNLLASSSIFKRQSKSDVKKIEKSLAMCECLQFKDSYFRTLSGGEKQRVLIAAALVSEPQILILDEPTNHLDIKYQTHVLKLIKKLNRESKITIIVVLHDINQAFKLADEVVCLKAGELLFVNEPRDVTSEQLSDAFDIKFKKHGDKVFVTSLD